MLEGERRAKGGASKGFEEFTETVSPEVYDDASWSAFQSLDDDGHGREREVGDAIEVKDVEVEGFLYHTLDLFLRESQPLSFMMVIWFDFFVGSGDV